MAEILLFQTLSLHKTLSSFCFSRSKRTQAITDLANQFLQKQNPLSGSSSKLNGTDQAVLIGLLCSFNPKEALKQIQENQLAQNLQEKQKRQLILWAIREGNLEALQNLLALFPHLPLNFRDQNGLSLLQLALFHGKTEIAEYLIEHKKASPQQHHGFFQDSLLIWAVEKNRADIVTFLLKHLTPAQVQQRNRLGRNALFYAMKLNAFSTAREIVKKQWDQASAIFDTLGKNSNQRDYIKFFNLALEKEEIDLARDLYHLSYTISLKNPLFCRTALDRAIKKRRFKTVEFLLKETQNDPLQARLISKLFKRVIKDQPKTKDETDTNYAILQLLIDRGVSLEEKDKHGLTPLAMAIFKNNIEVVNVLLKKIKTLPDAKQKDLLGFTYRTDYYSGHSFVFRDLYYGNLCFSASDFSTLLNYAIRKGYTEVALALIDAGADLKTENANKASPMRLAIDYKRLEIVKKLVITDPESLNRIIYYKERPLDYAIQMNTEVALALIDAGADLTANNDFNSSPMFLAVLHNHPEIVRKLIEKGITGPENLNQTFKGPEGDSLLHYAIRKGYT
ncbi:MAG: ankyrin repeat domain-containing protein, partial [Parachlamydiales bacterium]